MVPGGDTGYDIGLWMAEADRLYRAGNYEKAFALYLRVAKSGFPHACFKVGQMYHYGTGVAVDYEKAIYYYRMAAEQHNISACYHLALIYGKGKGVEKNLQEALRWLYKAMEEQNP